MVLYGYRSWLKAHASKLAAQGARPWPKKIGAIKILGYHAMELLSYSAIRLLARMARRTQNAKRGSRMDSRSPEKRIGTGKGHPHSCGPLPAFLL